ncbi:MAG: SCP2 sterol-binding domain-containing protein [Desulfomonile tiedjei]|nr:SCP2 sterol-binding domain-containing protein [Desulfomonile tiedjei]
MKLDDHPTVKWYREKGQTREASDGSLKLEPQKLRNLCMEAGADDAGFVDIDRPAIADQREDLLDALPGTKTLVCAIYRLNREHLRTPAHSITNLEFQQAWKTANEKARTTALHLQKLGFRALNVPVGFPMEMDRWPERPWLTVDKINAVEAGLGRMGWNRLLLHPKFGSSVVLGTVLTDAELTSYNTPLDLNPCIECKLCVSVCPVGAIGAEGHFNFPSCYTHNYRERIGGFVDWVERIVASRSVKDYRKKVSASETVSMWQNLSMGGQTRCDRCMGVCPAGEEVIGEYLEDRKGYIDESVTQKRKKVETVYVVSGSDAEAYVREHFPHKTIKRVSNGIRPNSAAMFLKSLPIAFQRGQAKGLNATYHFSFTGAESCNGTVTIRDQTVTVQDGLLGTADLHVTADSRTWIKFLAKETGLPWALISRKIRIKGSPKLMKAFAKCFPS